MVTSAVELLLHRKCASDTKMVGMAKTAHTIMLKFGSTYCFSRGTVHEAGETDTYLNIDLMRLYLVSSLEIWDAQYFCGK